MTSSRQSYRSEGECIYHATLQVLVDCPLHSLVKRSVVIEIIWIESNWLNPSCVTELHRTEGRLWRCFVSVCPELRMIVAFSMNVHTDRGQDVRWYFNLPSGQSAEVFAKFMQQDCGANMAAAEFPVRFHSRTRLSIWSAAVFVRCCWGFFCDFCSVYLISFYLLPIYTCYLLTDSTVFMMWNVCLPEKKPVSLLG